MIPRKRDILKSQFIRVLNSIDNNTSASISRLARLNAESCVVILNQLCDLGLVIKTKYNYQLADNYALEYIASNGSIEIQNNICYIKVNDRCFSASADTPENALKNCIHNLIIRDPDYASFSIG